jgi:hypothetical protein
MEQAMFRKLSPISENVGRLIKVAFVLGAISFVYQTAAFGADPADQMAKNGMFGSGGGLDLSGDAWMAIKKSLEDFLHPIIALRLFFNLAMAVACACLIAWHPRSSRADSLSNIEERKTLVVLAVVGAVVAEVTGINQSLAFVIFGIGALLRFRTALDNPKLTGKAITLVVVGLACGLGSWAMAAFVTGFFWILIFWLDSRIGCRLRIRLAKEVNAELTFGTVQALLTAQDCRVQNSTLYAAKRRLEFILHIPAALDIKQLEADIRATLPKTTDARIDFNVV